MKTIGIDQSLSNRSSFEHKCLNNILVGDPNDGGLKDSRDENDNIIISDSTFCSLLPPQLKLMSARYKVMCGC